MKAINPNIHPHGGYTFLDTDGVKHVGETWAGVISRVKSYRQRQGKPPGNVEAEVIAQACASNPAMCVEDNGVTKAQYKTVSLRSRVLQWLTRMRESKATVALLFVNSGLHAARTDVCLRCPRHQGMPTGCGSCKAALVALRQDIVGSNGSDPRLEACSVLGEFLPVSAWLDQQAIPNPELPAECWRKRTL